MSAACKYSDTWSRAAGTIAANGMVTTPNHLATQAGMSVLQEGGNAVEAAIAAAAALAVVYPHMNTIGGDNFWLIHHAARKKTLGLNASGRAGENATINFYKNKGLQRIPARGYWSANTVPGAVSGWDDAFRYSTGSMKGRLPWKSLLQPAIEYASEGFPVAPSLARWLDIAASEQDHAIPPESCEAFWKIFYKPNAQSYRVGEILRQPDLAASLGMIADLGAAAFYTGPLAHRIVSDLERNGGVLSSGDFARHKADWVEPLQVKYRDVVAYNLPPNTQGMTSLAILNILNNFKLQALGEGTADYYHLIIEATKQAFADRDKYLTDPLFKHIPLERLLSLAHGQQQAQRIRMDKAAVDLKPLDPMGDTVWVGVVDKQGNAVSLIQSIYFHFGSGVVPEGTGIVLQNRGSFFSLDQANVNCLQPHKRTFHSLNPAMLCKDGRPYLVYGCMGGEGQPQTQAAVVTRVADFGMSPQDAINAPRWLYGRTWGATSNDLKVEGRIPPGIVDELRRRGHVIQVVDDYTDMMGHAGAIWVHPESGVKHGASDPRSDGAAAGH